MARPYTRVFISRHQTPQSAFSQLLLAAGFTVCGRSLLSFEARTHWRRPPCDWLFFSSPRAARFFFENLPAADTLAGVQMAALGPGTATAVEQAGYDCAFMGKGDPQVVAKEFLRYARGQHVVFPRALHSRRSVQRALDGQIKATDIVVYENRPTADLPAGPFDVLVFTSPLNVEAWFSLRPREDGQRIIAIGQTTAEALRQRGITSLHIADQPTERAMAEAVMASA